jgi:hypothetical protein
VPVDGFAGHAEGFGYLGDGVLAFTVGGDRARTAVLHREADRGTRFELAREVAALIPGAMLIPLRVRATYFATATGSRSLTRCSGCCASPRALGHG